MILSYEHKSHLIVVGFCIAICDTLIFYPLSFIAKISHSSFFVVLAIFISLPRAWWSPHTSKNLTVFLMLYSVLNETVAPFYPNNSLHLATLETLTKIINRKSVGCHSKLVINTIKKARSIVLTFGHGLIDSYTNLFPGLKRQNIQAICFITSRDGNENSKFLNTENGEMHRRDLVEFDWATSQHIVLGSSPKEKTFRKIQENYSWIHETISTYLKYFACPYDSYTFKTTKNLKEICYQHSFTLQKHMSSV